MPDREDMNMKSILEACRKTGPMDERLVRGTAESSSRNSEEYHADAIYDSEFIAIILHAGRKEFCPGKKNFHGLRWRWTMNRDA